MENDSKYLLSPLSSHPTLTGDWRGKLGVTQTHWGLQVAPSGDWDHFDPTKAEEGAQ